MVIQGKVINVAMDIEFPKKDGSGSYQAFTLKYVNNRGEVREITKPMAGLKFKPTIAKTLRELGPGEVFTVQMEKNKAGYDDIVALTKGEGGIDMAAQVESAKASTASAPTGRVVGSNYETPEERKVKQRLIVRQAALNQALEFNKNVKNPEIGMIQEHAESFENWVYRGME